ncbi:hypothetical protein HG536_0B06480 [Torulaspora globosa]|uniref:Uncharacterized protein n=1 Tax=Torulaspora globosa TaxID=48254 RepID=A0A7G3ZE44_9SACH|nr:uncharacterized protein HG536_0B06480 [Torulaspora globosa]QLL31780.1 hypothetical protein HG536_0B06480 [Torulaspora globosa]
MEGDRQLEYARNAVRRYQEREALEAGAGGAAASQQNSSGNNKRHIVNVDDTSRINYEMIKNTPGNVPPAAGSEEAAQDAEISALKTKMYKGQLYRMNDEYLERVNGRSEELLRAEPGGGQVEVPLEDQHVWLQQIHEQLAREYRSLVNEEKKWIVLKELLLDANTELDLYSAQDPTMQTITLGSVAIPSNSNANALIFNRSKRQKIKNRGYCDDISPIL